MNHGTLIIVATPIGNLEDMTFRAVRALKEADLILAEQPQVTKKLLTHYRITTPVTKLNQHATTGELNRIIRQLEEGKTIAYTTSAGTPGISDPGARLVGEVRAALQDSVQITLTPGPSAVTALASVAGTPIDRFTFLGFPPQKKGRKTFFARVAASDLPVILYESPHRIQKTLQEAAEACGDEREAVIGRELTKQFEEILTGTLTELQQHPSVANPKGEFVLLVSPEKKHKSE
jgi:16S rRNA (cytidine1402-2'-O)-methyltransferase